MRLTNTPAIVADAARSSPLMPLRSPTVTAPTSPSTTLSASPSLGVSAIVLVVLAVVYNTLLAFLNAHGPYVGRPLVVVSEIVLLTAAALVLLRSGIRQSDTPALVLFAFFLAMALIVSLASGALFVDMARNVAIIVIFLMIGGRVGERTVRTTFAILAVAVFAILLLESLSVETYAWLLEPGRYFEQTRGVSRFEFDEIGLFANALGFDERFSILKIVGHRTSSLFLEQVSLANFATVLTVFLVAMWPRLGGKSRIAYPLLIAFILVTNNSRTALAIALAAPLVYLVAPKVPRLVTLGLMPVVLLSAVSVTAFGPPIEGDNLVGRLRLTVRHLGDLDLPAMLGTRATEAATFADSGYVYVIYASTIVGLLALWLFFSLVSTGASAVQKRASIAVGLYLFFNLTVSGTSIFSIKTAALLWFLIGFLQREEPVREAAAQPEEPSLTGGRSFPRAGGGLQPAVSPGRLRAAR